MTRAEAIQGKVWTCYYAGKDAMDNGAMYSASSAGFRVDRAPVIIGACLIGAGSMIAITGVAVSGVALIAATRRWLRELEVPPSEVVKQKWGQTKAATVAGASAWQHHHNGIHRAHA